MKITNMSQVTTKLGDKGYSSNYVQEKYRKDNILFDVLGTNDELSSWLGLTYHYSQYEPILKFQAALQSMKDPPMVAIAMPTQQELKIHRYSRSGIVSGMSPPLELPPLPTD